MKSLIRLKNIAILFLLISVIAIIGSGYYFWKYNVSGIGLKNTNLNITNILDSSVMKSVQFNVDYFFTTGKYAEIASYEVQAGFDINKDDIIEKDLGNGKKKYTVKLPSPKIINVDTSDKGLIITAKENTELAKPFREYGEEYAKNIALQNKILEKAQTQVKKIFSDFAKNVNMEIDVELSPIEKEKEKLKTFKSKRYPLSLKYSDNLNIDDVNNHITNYAFYLYDKNDRNTIMFSYPVYEASAFNEEFERRRLLFNVNSNQKIYFNYIDHDNPKIIFNFILENKMFHIGISSNNRDKLIHFFPKALKVIYSIKKEDNCENCNKKRDFYGIILDEWQNAKINDLRDFIQQYFDIYYSLIYFLPEKIYDIPIMTDSDKYFYSGEAYYKDDSKKCIREIQNVLNILWQKYNLNTDEVIFILFDYNKVHRDRFVIFLKNKLIFYTPERGVYPFKEKEVHDEIYYHELFSSQFVSYEDGKYCFGKDTDKCLDENPYSIIFSFLKSKGFISLYKSFQSQ